MKKAELHKRLTQLTKEQLLKEILELYQRSAYVKDYYDCRYTKKGVDNLLIKHKKIIQAAFSSIFDKNQRTKAQQSINVFDSICDDKEKVAELRLFYIERGINYTLRYGDIDESFYEHLTEMYEKTLQLIDGNDLLMAFQQYCQAIVIATQQIGWGFHDHLSELYEEFYYA